MTIPTDAKARKNLPITRGLLDYFPDACLAVAELSRIGNEQHNPGQPMHWAREKSSDHRDCAVRHIMDAGKVDTDGVRHMAKAAWRCLAQLQLEIEEIEPAEQPGALARLLRGDRRIGPATRRKTRHGSIRIGCGRSNWHGRREGDKAIGLTLPE